MQIEEGELRKDMRQAVNVFIKVGVGGPFFIIASMVWVFFVVCLNSSSILTININISLFKINIRKIQFVKLVILSALNADDYEIEQQVQMISRSLELFLKFISRTISAKTSFTLIRFLALASTKEQPQI